MLRAYISPYRDLVDQDADRALDDVGTLAVLHAMVTQRVEAAAPAVDTDAKTPDESGMHPRPRLPSNIDSLDPIDGFQKIR